MKLRHFTTAQEALDYVFDELIATLEDDAMNNADEPGEEETVADLRDRIHDIEMIRYRVALT